MTTQKLVEALRRIKSNLMHQRRFGVCDMWHWRRAAAQAEGDIEEALAAHSAAQAQAVEDERGVFEAYCCARWRGDRDGLRIRDMPGSERLGEYVLGPVQFAWDAWQARAGRASAQAVPAWLPIATAPTDGTEVLAFNGERALMHWIEGRGYALWAYADVLLSDACPEPEQPTHWMPLPAAPKGD